MMAQYVNPVHRATVKLAMCFTDATLFHNRCRSIEGLLHET